MKIVYCKATKRNYFDLVYHYNFAGHFDIKKHYDKAVELANTYNYSIESMFEFEVQVSSRVKRHVIMYSSLDNQEPIDGASIYNDINDYLK